MNRSNRAMRRAQIDLKFVLAKLKATGAPAMDIRQAFDRIRKSENAINKHLVKAGNLTVDGGRWELFCKTITGEFYFCFYNRTKGTYLDVEFCDMTWKTTKRKSK